MIPVSCPQLQDEIPGASRDLWGLSFLFFNENTDRSPPLENFLCPKHPEALSSDPGVFPLEVCVSTDRF